MLDVEIRNILWTYGLVFGEYSICDGSKSQNTHFIDLLGAELSYDSVMIYETEAHISLISCTGINCLILLQLLEKLLLVQIKQVIRCNVDILILNPILGHTPPQQNVRISCIYLECGLNCVSLCVIVGNDWLFMDLEKYQQSFSWIYFNIVIRVFIFFYYSRLISNLTLAISILLK